MGQKCAWQWAEGQREREKDCYIKNIKSTWVFHFCQYTLLLLPALLFHMHLRRKIGWAWELCSDFCYCQCKSRNIEPVCVLKAHSDTRFKLTFMLLKRSDLEKKKKKGCRSGKKFLFSLIWNSLVEPSHQCLPCLQSTTKLKISKVLKKELRKRWH